MKYLVLSTFEIDGHSSASVMLCANNNAKEQYLKSLLYDEDEKTFYPTHNKYTNDEGATIMYGEWPCGEWNISILPFKTFKEITNRERYTQTG